MGGPCKGVCDGDAPSLKAMGVRIYHYQSGRGRPPADPDTGTRAPGGSYGPWSKCRVCQIYLTWPGRNCPCCSQRLRKRTPSARAHQAQRRWQAAKAAKAAAAEAGALKEGGVEGAVPLVPIAVAVVVVPDKRRRAA